MDAKTPIIAATATAMSSHMVRGERFPFDCSVMKVCSKTPEYQARDNRAPAAFLAFLESAKGYLTVRRRASVLRFLMGAIGLDRMREKNAGACQSHGGHY
jgi:hypothetical protein